LSLTGKEVAEILKALEGSSFDTLDLELNGVKLQLRRGGSAAPVASAIPVPAVPVRPAHSSSPVSPSAPVPAGAEEALTGTSPVTAPLLGIFYRAPKPGEPPFVEVGACVEADTIIGIIEVMKLMNSVRAGVRGRVVAIPARNGELVEYGETLLYVQPD
jgi:acetyl-CoA carboxylase biotin carboxyl carrier protein